MASLIASAYLFIWKMRCDCIFNNKLLDFTNVARIVVDHVKDFLVSSVAEKGLQFFHANKPQASHLHIYTAAC